MAEDPRQPGDFFYSQPQRIELLTLFHATTSTAWQSILDERRMKISEFPYDWLGTGVYFWQSAPGRAWVWKVYQQIPDTKRATPEECVVLKLEIPIEIGNCIDFLDVFAQDLLTDEYQRVEDSWRALGVSEANIEARKSENQNLASRTRHFLDCAVINILRDDLLKRTPERRRRIDMVRAPYQHLAPVYPNSSFHIGDHVHVCLQTWAFDPTKMVEIVGLNEIEPLIPQRLKELD